MYMVTRMVNVWYSPGGSYWRLSTSSTRVAAGPLPLSDLNLREVGPSGDRLQAATSFPRFGTYVVYGTNSYFLDIRSRVVGIQHQWQPMGVVWLFCPRVQERSG